jgi:hypothetical protein
MKLISEIIEQVQIITEEKSKDLYLEGVFLQSELANRNNRIYPKAVMEKEVARYMKEYVDSNRAFGELGHPEGPTINLDRVSHIITSLKEDGNNYIGRAKILNTPMGNIVRGLIEGGAQLGVSSRGMGTLKEREGGINEVQNDFYLATAADIVADPSAPDAFVQGIMENKEWMFVNGGWTYQNMDETKKLIETTKKQQLEEMKFRVFENFMNSLSKK